MIERPLACRVIRYHFLYPPAHKSCWWSLLVPYDLPLSYHYTLRDQKQQNHTGNIKKLISASDSPSILHILTFSYLSCTQPHFVHYNALWKALRIAGSRTRASETLPLRRHMKIPCRTITAVLQNRIWCPVYIFPFCHFQTPNYSGTSFPTATANEVQLLAESCQPADFDINRQNAMDESYRKARKLDAMNFSMINFWDRRRRQDA